jgi:cytoskeletal protein CcmA (bactofilin family)
MWKKGESEETGVPDSSPPRPVPSSPGADRSPRGPREAAIIGPSITIRGDVTGDEDLMIQGRIEGTVTLKQHNVFVGPEGRVDASIHARSVVVEGEVKGDLHGAEQVVLKKTAKVQGNVQSPRVTVEDGARFRGGIDMGEPSAAGEKPPAVVRREPAKSFETPARPGTSAPPGDAKT